MSPSFVQSVNYHPPIAILPQVSSRKGCAPSRQGITSLSQRGVAPEMLARTARVDPQSEWQRARVALGTCQRYGGGTIAFLASLATCQSRHRAIDPPMRRDTGYLRSTFEIRDGFTGVSREEPPILASDTRTRKSFSAPEGSSGPPWICPSPPARY